MIAHTMAIRHPSRVLSLTSISSTPSPRIGRARVTTAIRLLIANPAVLTRRPPTTSEQASEQLVRACRIVGSPGYAVDEAWLRRATNERGLDPAGVRCHSAAILASGDRTAALAGIRVSTLVLHGVDDPIVRLDTWSEDGDPAWHGSASARLTLADGHRRDPRTG